MNHVLQARTAHIRPQTVPPLLSIVVPFYNEATVLPLCLARILAVTDVLNEPVELIFVDDGSIDGSAEILAEASADLKQVKIIRLSRNFGKEAAMTAGIEHSRGEALIILDADLQDPPELIPDMLKVWREGADVVLMQRSSRAGESWAKRASAHLYYRLLNRLSSHSIPPDVGDFRLMNRRAIDALNSLPERNRYMKGLFAWIGMETRILRYDRAPRAAGITKWDYLGLIRLAMEGITSFSISPLRCSTVLGAGAASLGALYGIWIVLKAMLLGDAVVGYPSLIAVITFLGGCQLLTIGILGEYVGKTYMEAKQRPNYLVREIIAAPTEAAVESLTLYREVAGGE
ncbi:glycosyltransferase family 2 protein [Spongiibacter marinus]|uniref:glycosyltransferase family 2 protein n=1 Tax=Spongiibacter marinus TaxID=354246 RepID=UPI003C4FF53B